MKKRISFIDIARAFAIIFIVLGHTLVHSKHCEIIFKFLYSFHVMLFFILSGYTFKVNEKFTTFLKKKIFRIVIPYIIWALLFLIPYMLLGKNVGKNIGTSSSFDLKTQIFNVLYGNGNNNALKQNSSLWFLPALFSMEILYYWVIKICNKIKINEIFALLPMVTISYITNAFLPVILPWGINTALTLGVFFLIGFLFRKYDITSSNKFKLIYMFPVFTIGVLAFYFNGTVSCINYDYCNFILMMLSGVCLSIIFIFISYIMKENRLLEYIGRNTMGILIFHKLIILIFQTKLGPISMILKNSNIWVELLISCFVVVLSIICSLIGTEIVRKILPILIGENKK